MNEHTCINYVMVKKFSVRLDQCNIVHVPNNIIYKTNCKKA